MSHNFQIAETETFQKKIKRPDLHALYDRISHYVYPQLKTNPYFGLNIKKLKGEFEGIYRYRIREYRLFYTIDKEKVIVFIIDIEPRKDSYK